MVRLRNSFLAGIYNQLKVGFQSAARFTGYTKHNHVDEIIMRSTLEKCFPDANDSVGFSKKSKKIIGL
jgi:hypothetical protein